MVFSLPSSVHGGCSTSWENTLATGKPSLEQCTVKCRYNAVQFIPILHTVLRKQRQKVNQILESQQTSHISPSRASYGVSFVKILKKIDRVITAPHCIIQTTMTSHEHLKCQATWLFAQQLVWLRIKNKSLTLLVLCERNPLIYQWIPFTKGQ